MASVYTQQLIEEAIRDFSFSDYGMDDVDEIKNEEWVPDLATHIITALESDPKREVL